MSEIGIVSQEYQTSAELFHLINESVITLKKRHFNLTGAAQVSDEQANRSNRLLVDFLKHLIRKLENPTSAETISPQIEISPFFVKRLQEKYGGSLEWYVEDLEGLLAGIEGEGSLSSEQIKYLDELCGQLDAETTALHRRMWRK